MNLRKKPGNKQHHNRMKILMLRTCKEKDKLMEEYENVNVDDFLIKSGLFIKRIN
jgi:hypothetical protein